MSLTINLIGNEDGDKSKKSDPYFRKIINLGIFTFFGVILIFSIRYGINYYQLMNLDGELQSLETRLNSGPIQEYYESYNKYLNHEARTILANHAHYSQLIEHFDGSITADIEIFETSFTAGDASIRGNAKKGIKSFTIFEKNLEKRGYSEIEITSIQVSPDSDRVDFSISFKFDENIIKRQG